MIGPATHAFDLARTCWAWVQLVSDAQSVVAMRLMGLSGTWSVPAGETSEMIREKAPAFTEALVASTLSAVAGEGPTGYSRRPLPRCQKPHAPIESGWHAMDQS